MVVMGDAQGPGPLPFRAPEKRKRSVVRKHWQKHRSKRKHDWSHPVFTDYIAIFRGNSVANNVHLHDPNAFFLPVYSCDSTMAGLQAFMHPTSSNASGAPREYGRPKFAASATKRVYWFCRVVLENACTQPCRQQGRKIKDRAHAGPNQESG